MDETILFIEGSKIATVGDYLQSIRVTVRDYNDIWTFLRRKEWG